MSAVTPEQYATLCEEEREKRLALLRAWRSKIARAISDFDPTQATAAEITQAVRMLNDHSRLEHRPVQAVTEPATPAVEVATTPAHADPLEGLKLFRPAS